MNQRLLQPSALAAADASSELAAIRVDRAQTELKHGRAIALMAQNADALPAGLLMASVDTLTSARLQWLQSHGQPLRLLLTAERAQALGLLEDAAHAVSVVLPVACSVDLLQDLGAASPSILAGDSFQGLISTLSDLRPADEAMASALVLAKRARLAPALVVVDLPTAAAPLLQDGAVLQVTSADVGQVQHSARLRLHRVSDAHVPIAAHDNCSLVLFRETNGDAEHIAIIVGQPDLQQPVPVRLHSACLTGDLLGSLRCDCGDQLRRAIDHLAEAGGVLLYLAQEGRGTGLASKLRAYRLQDDGMDTIDADRYLGFQADERDFQAAAGMLDALGIRRIQLMTNNPQKIEALQRGGIEVVDRLALIAPVNPHNARYIQTKQERAGHLSHAQPADH
jgi:GTP cyclohydrolase II